MKKWLKILLIVLAGITLLLAVGTGLLCLPGVQKQVALSFLGKSASRVELESIRVGTSGMRLSGLVMDVNGTLVRVDRASVKAQMLPLLLKREYSFRSIELEGVVVNLLGRNKNQPFRGILSVLDVGGPLIVDELEVDGQIKLLTNLDLDLKINGDGLKPGATAVLDVSGGVLYKTDDGGQAFDLSGTTLGIVQDDGGRIESLKFEAGTGLDEDQDVALTGSASVEWKAGIESYFLELALKNKGRRLQILEGSGEFGSESRELEFQLSGSAVYQQMLAFAPSIADRIPEGLELKMDATGGTRNGAMNLESGKLVASLGGGRLEFSLLKPFEIDMDRGVLTDLKPGTRVAGLKVILPVSSILPKAQIVGPPLVAEFFLKSLADGFQVSNDKPVTWPGLQWLPDQEKGAQFELSARTSLHKQGAQIKVEVQDLRLMTSDAEILQGSVAFIKEEASGLWKVKADALARISDMERIYRGGIPSTSFFRPQDLGRFDLSADLREEGLLLHEANLNIGVRNDDSWLQVGLSGEVNVRSEKDGGLEMDAEKGLLRVVTNGLDPARIKAFLPSELNLDLKPVNSEWVLVRSQTSGVELKTRNPLVVENLSVGWKGKQYKQFLQGEELRGKPVLRFGKDGVEFRASNLVLGGESNRLADGSFFYKSHEAGPDWGGSFKLMLPRASKSVLFKGSKGAIKSGTADLDVAPMASGSGIKLDVQLQEVALGGLEETAFNAKVDLAWPKSGEPGKTFEAKMEIQDAKNTDRSSDGVFSTFSPDRHDFISSELHLEHILLLKELFTAYEAKAPDDRLGPYPHFDLKTKVDSLHLAEGEAFQHVQTDFISRAEGVSLRGLTGSLGEGNFQGQMGYRYLDGKLGGNLNMSGVQLEDFFVKRESKDRSPIEGRANIGMIVSATGKDPDRLLESADIQLSVVARDGTWHFKKLEKKLDEKLEASRKLSGNLEKAGDGLGLLSGPIRLINPKLGDLTEAVGKGGKVVADGLGALTYFLRIPGAKSSLTRIRYDSLELEAHRNPAGHTKLKKFMVRGPMILVGGTGGLGPRPTDQFMDAPLKLDLSIGTRGPIAQVFSTLKQIDSENQYEDFMLLKANPIEVRGTLRNPHMESLWSIIFPKGVTINGSPGRNPLGQDGLPVNPSNPLRDAVEKGASLLPLPF